MIYLYIFLGLLALLLSVLLIGGLLFFKFAITRPSLRLRRKGGEFDAFSKYHDSMIAGSLWNRQHLGERVSIKSDDGLALSGLYLAAAGQQRRIVLLAHGYRGTWYGDFSNVIKYYHEHGCGVLAIDERAHGESEGRYITFGAKERFDIAAWARYLSDRFGSQIPIYLQGLSMGCSSVLMALGLALPDNVVGAVGDCGFTSPREIFIHFMKTLYHLPVYPLLWFFDFYCRIFASFGIGSCSVAESLSANARPVLFIHGKSDNFVPTAMTIANYDACRSHKELYLVDGATHAVCSLAAPTEFFGRIFDFFAFCEEKKAGAENN